MAMHRSTDGRSKSNLIGRVFPFPERARSAAGLVRTIVRNLVCASKLSGFETIHHDGLVISPPAMRHLPAVRRLYAEFNGKALGIDRSAVLLLQHRRLCLTVRREDTDQLIGLALYFFNQRDRVERTVHESYIGLVAGERNAGIGTVIRRHALRSFAMSTLLGVSSRISAGNLASLKGNEKLGFQRIDSYFDEESQEHRFYLKCDLAPYRG